MSRQYCTRCHRPLVTCICEFTYPTANQVEILILQHKSEEKRTKGTAGLLALGLDKCQVFVGEDFSDDAQLNTLLNEPGFETFLLYPGEASDVAAPLEDLTKRNVRLVVLDGTWKKAYKMLQLSKNLHGLSKITLPENFTSEYHIRKHHDPRGLSTLESVVHSLSILENDTDKYQNILIGFKQFNDFQSRLAHTGGN
ncbi:tRNA-uridine aminocarboxypropyltransferase [Thalassotalea sp. PS06]|uniref:tRNA-uridine aminocarboxypropyltransferase n=1 Tax=Thalassotalea sp. PS06 TaxID=2594005 RepID=UPI001165427E|nr:tRNA-uridine aminocarboxypropyltransferase [Thalassotalea sp. PS06]QDP01067.1 DTW domain-containing protein [Thalassotalea sp. PS06]